MKPLLSLFSILLLLPALHANLVECIQYRDHNGQSPQGESIHEGKWPIPESKGSITEISPLLFNEEELSASTFYEGFVILYTKTDETVSLKITSNIFQGFLELDSEKYSPMFVSDQMEIEIPRRDLEWVEVRIKGRKEPLFIRCAEFKGSQSLQPITSPTASSATCK